MARRQGGTVAHQLSYRPRLPERSRHENCSHQTAPLQYTTVSERRSQDGAARVGEEAAGELREGDDEAPEPAEHLEPGPGAGQESQEAAGAGGRRTGPVQVSSHQFHMLFPNFLSLVQ